MKVKQKLFSMFLSFFAAFLLVAQSTSPALPILVTNVFAEEAPTPSPTPSPNTEPSSPPDPTPLPIPTPTPSPTASPEPSADATASASPADDQSSQSWDQSNQNPDQKKPEKSNNSLPSPAPTITPKVETKDNGKGKVSVDIVHGATSIAHSLLATDPPTAESSAKLTTDKADYSPTDTAVISGSGFSANTTYSLVISSSDQPAVNLSVNVTTSDSGTFTYSYQLDGNYRPNYKVELKDSGGNIIATTTFTDSATINSATLNGTSSVSVGPGDTITAAVTATGSSGSNKWEGTGWAISTAVPGSFACEDTPKHDNGQQATESFSITAPQSAGTYNAYFKVFSNNGCSNDPSSLISMPNGVTVQARDLTATKSNNLGGGNATINSPFNWKIRVSSAGPATATFSNNNELLKDEMPNSGVNDYGAPSIATSGTTGTVNCTQDGSKKENLSCKANGTVTLPSGSFFDVTVTVNPNATGTLVNPRATKTCAADTGNNVVETDETNNSCSESVTVAAADAIPPTTTDSGIDTSWHNTNVTVTLTCTDNPGGSGCANTYHTTDGSTPTTSSSTANPFTLTTDGNYTVKYFSKDVAGNSEAVKTATNTVKIDKTNPVDPTVTSPSHTASTWSNDNTVDMSWSGATDSLSGVAGYSYLFDTSAATAPDHVSEGSGTSTTSSPLANGNSNYFHLATVDNAGNWTSTVHKGPFFIDTTAPAVSANNASASWRISNVNITLSVSDSGGSGLKSAKYNWDAPATASVGTNFTNGNTISIPSDGNHTLYLYADDNAGNSNTFSGTYKLDTASPTTTDSGIDGDWHNADVTVTLNCTDTTSGCASTYHTTDGSTPTTGSSTINPFTLSAEGNYTIKYFSQDNAGNSEAVKTAAKTVKIDKTNPATPSASPVAGDYTSDQSVTLASSDSLSGLDKIYYTTDGSAPNNTKTLYSGAITVDRDMTIKAIAYDKAGNTSAILTAVYGIPPIISGETSSSVSSSSATITWTTDDPSTSRVIYDSSSHSTLGTPPNYGYPNSTVETDTSPEVTSHSVTVSGLTAGITYYFRTISRGSPEAISSEKSFTTSNSSSTNSSTTSSSTSTSTSSTTTSTNPTGGAVIPVSGQPAGTVLGETSQNKESEVLAESTSSASPSPTPTLENQNEGQRSHWFNFTNLVIGAGFLIMPFLTYFFFRRKKSKDSERR